MAKKRLFDPKDSTPFPLSRTKLALYLDCPRCFWMDRRFGVSRPPGFPLSLNLAIDVLLKREFDHYRAKGEPHPFLSKVLDGVIPADVPELREWRNPFKGVRRLHPASGFIVFGAIDDLWAFPDGDRIIVDYKAAATSKSLSLDAEHRVFYRRQLDIYHWIMTGMGVQLAPFTFVLWANARKDAPLFNTRLDFEFTLSPHKPSHDWIEPALVAARSCLMADSPPSPSAKCDCCRYRTEANRVEHES